MSQQTATMQNSPIPLCVDLDGTLIKTDLLWESFVRLLKRNPLWLFVIPFWWMRGRAFLKRQLAARITLDPAILPYNEPFLVFLREARRSGRKLILATASDRALADLVAGHIGIFDEVLASDGIINLRSANKLKALTEKFGVRGFDYAGNSSADLAVWRGTREAIVVNASPSLTKKAAGCTKLGPAFPPDSHKLSALFRCLRPHQWVKNVIVFVPAIAAHKLADHSSLLNNAQAFVAFCLCASGVYIVNDLLDLDADRGHSGKKRRPFAAGDLPLQTGLILGPALLAAGGVVSVMLSKPFAGVMALYFVLTMSYSWRVRQMALLDVFFLAGLYTIRIFAGSVATATVISHWLLAFSVFFFLNLALIKRVSELFQLRLAKKGSPEGRGYQVSDIEILSSLGACSGYISVLVLALYINSAEIREFYSQPEWLWLVLPLLLFWVSRIWLLNHRGLIHEDPVVFALKDKVSYLIGVLVVLVVFVATGKS